MKVYLDDERKTPISWERTYTVAETIELLKTGRVTELSLDHDLAEEHYAGDYSKSPTGYEVLVWIEEQVALNGFVPPRMKVHSMNPSGKEKMNAAIRRILQMDQKNAKRKTDALVAELPSEGRKE